MMTVKAVVDVESTLPESVDRDCMDEIFLGDLPLENALVTQSIGVLHFISFGQSLRMMIDMLVCIGHEDERDPDLPGVFSSHVVFVERAPKGVNHSAADGNKGSRYLCVKIHVIEELEAQPDIRERSLAVAFARDEAAGAAF